MKNKKYRILVDFVESCFEKYGDNYLGVGWSKKKEDVDTRYKVMLEVIKEDAPERISLLDFGCGASHLYEYILLHKLKHIEYNGLDVSEKFINVSRSKYPSINYYHMDILEDCNRLPDFDYIVINGIFTAKCELSFEEMLSHFQETIIRVFEKTKKGVAFNTMSKQVDWERNDLFHLPFDVLARFLTKHVSRHFVIRHDYGLYEYTTYVYKQANNR